MQEGTGPILVDHVGTCNARKEELEIEQTKETAECDTGGYEPEGVLMSRQGESEPLREAVERDRENECDQHEYC